jgi:hypothetical protein
VTKEAQLASSFGDAYFFSYMKKEGLQMTAPEFLKSEYFKNSVEFGFQYRMESIPELRVPEGLRHSSDLSWLGE